jgi:hypothetical protein
MVRIIVVMQYLYKSLFKTTIPLGPSFVTYTIDNTQVVVRQQQEKQ